MGWGEASGPAPRRLDRPRMTAIFRVHALVAAGRAARWQPVLDTLCDQASSFDLEELIAITRAANTDLRSVRAA